ncbi:MAG: hypothetical protein LWW95_10110 [Candidatus Desulfofervidus auxilii]|nr:hypothetical protein [Candidatus Desulfofervidus auxilii]
MKNNPFKKGTLAHFFYRIDKFISNPKVALSKKIGEDVFNIISLVLLPLQIIFILIKFVVEILWAITIGLIITSLIS